MESKIISQLNRDYTRNVGKHYLMYGNLRSTLIRFSQRTIYLNIQVSSKWTKSPDETALQIAESWRRLPERFGAGRQLRGFIESHDKPRAKDHYPR